MIKWTYSIFMSSNKSIFFINIFVKFFFIYIEMSKNSSSKYYQDNKERLQKRNSRRCQSLSIKENEKKSTISSWAIQKSSRTGKVKGGWI